MHKTNKMEGCQLEKRIVDNEDSSNNIVANIIYSDLKVKGSSPRAFSFIITGLNLIYNKKFSKNELKEIITDGDGDKEIDAIYIHNNYIDIFDFSNDDPASNEMITLKKSIEENILRKPRDYSKFNGRLQKKLQEIHSCNKTKKIRLFVVRNSGWKNGGKEMDELKKLIETTKNGNFEYLNRKRLVQKITEPENYLPEWKFSVDPSEQIEFVSANKKEALLRISVKELLILKKENDEKGFDLFNKNVRIFLNKENLSKQIKNVIEVEPEMFSTYHNGILIVTPKLIERGAGVIIIERPQIVNGAQTINSLYKEYATDLSNINLSKAKIICKIIVANKELTNKVCETSNTQIPIKPWDLRANDDIQLLLEKIISNFSKGRYYYSRKGNLKKKGKITITLAEFFQILYSIMSKDPAYAKNNKKLLFDVVSKDGKYNGIVNYVNNIKPEEIERLCKAYHFVKEQIKGSNKKIKGLLKDADMHIITLMYIKNKYTTKYFKHIASFINNYVEEQKKIIPEISNNKIFTKSTDIWKKLIKIK